ncbi:small acid-soluble spore protein H, partial [Priestia megaterium]
QRAQEIADSVDMANVIYNGKSIYIEHVDQQNGVATIHNLDEPNNKQSVSISELTEQ